MSRKRIWILALLLLASALLLVLAPTDRPARSPRSAAPDRSEGPEPDLQDNSPRAEDSAPDPAPAKRRATVGKRGWLRGIVVTDPDRPVAGAEVFLDAGRIVRRRIRSGPDGRFEFRDLPLTYIYSVGASLRKTGIADVVGVVSSSTAIRFDGEAPDGEVRLVLLPVFYQAVEVVDQRGRPVDLRGAEVQVGGWGLIYLSDMPDRSQEPLLRILGVDLPASPGLLAFFWAVPRPDSVPATVPVFIPGYLPAAPELRWRPASKWPAAGRLVLRRDPESSVRKVVIRFPALRKPDAAPTDPGLLKNQDLRLHCAYHRNGKLREQSLWRERCVIYVDDLKEIRIKRQLGANLEYDLEKNPGSEVWTLQPRYPRWGYVEVRWVQTPGRVPTRWRLTLGKGVDGSEAAATSTPIPAGEGRFRIGPLAPGPYLLRRHIPGTDVTASPGSGNQMRVDLEGGIHVVEWE